MMKPLVIVAALPVLSILWLLAQTASNEAPPPSLPFENMGQVWLAIIMLIGAIVTHVANSRREERQRQWLIEDRKSAKEDAERAAKNIRTELLSEADSIKQEAWKRADTLKDAIDENTKISSDAFKAANDVNLKIAAVGALRRGESKEKRRVEDASDDTPSGRSE